MEKPAASPVPRLQIDDVLYGKEGRPHPRGVLERRIVWNLLHHLGQAGYLPCGVGDTEGYTNVNTAVEAMELVFNLDLCNIDFRKAEGKRAIAYVQLVLGNGIDVISDYTMPKAHPDFVIAMHAFDAEDFA